MAEQLRNQDDDLFQLWTVSPQENVKTIIIQQPAKSHMELNASTDKTAISSFGFSVLVAMILGGFATWYAYWCAKKSFDLTKQSFDSVIKQIESSEKVTLMANKELFQNQRELQIMNQKIEIFRKNSNELRADIIDFTVQAEAFATYIGLTQMKYADHIFCNKVKDKTSIDYVIFEEIQDQLKSMQKLQTRIRFQILNLVEHRYDEVIGLISSIMINIGILNNLLMNDDKSLADDIKNFRQKIKSLSQLANEILKNEIILENLLK